MHSFPVHDALADIPVAGFHTLPWQEFHLDADASVFPDIVGTMTDMAVVQTGFANAIYSSHGIEHLYWHDVLKTLREFFRVLKTDGLAVITCPEVHCVMRVSRRLPASGKQQRLTCGFWPAKMAELAGLYLVQPQ